MAWGWKRGTIFFLLSLPKRFEIFGSTDLISYIALEAEWEGCNDFLVLCFQTTVVFL